MMGTNSKGWPLHRHRRSLTGLYHLILQHKLSKGCSCMGGRQEHDGGKIPCDVFTVKGKGRGR